MRGGNRRGTALVDDCERVRGNRHPQFIRMEGIAMPHSSRHEMMRDSAHERACRRSAQGRLRGNVQGRIRRRLRAGLRGLARAHARVEPAMCGLFLTLLRQNFCHCDDWSFVTPISARVFVVFSGGRLHRPPEESRPFSWPAVPFGFSIDASNSPQRRSARTRATAASRSRSS